MYFFDLNLEHFNFIKAFLSFFSTTPYFILMFIYNLILMLVITLVIAVLTLVERRVLSLVQRRVGPNQVGYRGRLQFIADALKLLLKGIVTPDLSNKKLFLFVPAFALIVCYTFWLNSIWGPSTSVVEIEYNIVFLGLMSFFFSLSIILVGIFSKNKYTILASVRCFSMGINLEVMLGFFYLILVTLHESFSFSAAITYQSSSFYNILLLLPILPAIIVMYLLETNRAPFDLAEAESELVAGYTTELSGFFFALFYLGEYFHLFFFSYAISIFLLGGWL